MHIELKYIKSYCLPRCRNELFKKSFVPDPIQLWNSLSKKHSYTLLFLHMVSAS